jgi:transmembrane sensor
VYSNKSAQFSITKTRKLMLSPNQEAIYDPASEELSQRIVEQPEVIPDVPDLKMKFVNAPAAQIFDVLEKAYGIDIQFSRKSFAGCTLTTDLSEEGFYQRIDALCHALNAEYQVTEASVIINSNGCN